MCVRLLAIVLLSLKNGERRRTEPGMEEVPLWCVQATGSISSVRRLKLSFSNCTNNVSHFMYCFLKYSWAESYKMSFLKRKCLTSRRIKLCTWLVGQLFKGRTEGGTSCLMCYFISPNVISEHKWFQLFFQICIPVIHKTILTEKSLLYISNWSRVGFCYFGMLELNYNHSLMYV